MAPASAGAARTSLRLSPLLCSALLLCTPCLISSSNDAAAPSPTCSAGDDLDEDDPSLRRFEFDIGYGPEVFTAYIQRDVSTFYGEEPGTRTPMEHSHGGMAGKFVNLSPERVRLYWDPGNGSPGDPHAIMGPFQAVGTATFPFHKFYITPMDDPDTILMKIPIKKGTCVYYYDPIEVPGDPARTLQNLARLTLDELEKYEKQKRSRLFDAEYKSFTGRDYLARYPRPRPRHYLWRADRFGQEHWVTTRETHFAAMPPASELGKIETFGRARALADDEPRALREYRDPDRTELNMTLRVLSCAPRAFEVRNFLSDVEIRHVLHLATGMELGRSSTSAGEADGDDERDDSDTRTSRNTWVPREDSPIIDAIYRRAADLLRIDEALLRHRGDGERPDFERDGGIAESLQLVHYDVAQEYTAHHDFGFGDINSEAQEERFATLLLYLNEGMEGGETSFPKWENAETEDGLDVVPERGKAVLFYSQLPDGNMDELSIHAAKPVTKGEKWLMNLWIHDPFYE